MSRMSDEDHDFYKPYLNNLVMSYLAGKGYVDVAAEFLKESKATTTIDLDVACERVKIQNSLLQGDIDKAKEILTTIEPQFLEKNPSVSFLLTKQKVIELIKGGTMDKALEYATESFPPFADMNMPAYMQEIEQIMSLLAFEDPTTTSAASLLGQEHRVQVANTIKTTLLRFQNEDLEPTLATLARHFYFLEQQLQLKLKRVPQGIIFKRKRQAIDQTELQ